MGGKAKEWLSVGYKSIFVHGYASLLANNEMDYDEQLLEALLTKVYMGAVYAAKEAKDEEGKCQE